MAIAESFTAVVERAQNQLGPFATEPYEGGWAHEALIFLKALRAPEGSRVTGRVQISPDGVDWIDEGATFPPLTQVGLSFVRVRHFGNWLRVIGEVDGPDTGVDLVVYLSLKQ